MQHPSSLFSSCPVCSAQDIELFLEIPRVPVHCNLLRSTRSEAIHAPKGDIRLGLCARCGHIFNLAFDPGLMTYRQEYENSLHFSVRFQEYAVTLAQRLIAQYTLHGKDIIEIGCGRGDFLMLLCELGDNRGVGFDPGFSQERISRNIPEKVTFVNDYYSRKYAGYTADLVCCRHVLEHIHAPRTFLADLHDAISGNGTALFFEVPDVRYTLRDLGIWDLIYEHCSYFSPSSLARAFALSDFKVLKVSKAFGGQFLWIDAVPGVPASDTMDGLLETMEEIEVYAHTFGDTYAKKLSCWSGTLDDLSRESKRTVVWGGGSKGVSFLNMTRGHGAIEYVVDVNPYKQGKFVPATGQEIVAPGFLKQYKPDVIIVMNPLYTDEVRQDIEQIGITSNVVTA